jgi:hypothetical protein
MAVEVEEVSQITRAQVKAEIEDDNFLLRVGLNWLAVQDVGAARVYRMPRRKR